MKTTKATPEQCEEAKAIYEKKGQTAVCKYANEEKITSWSRCKPCDDVTPNAHDDTCLVCGTVKAQNTNLVGNLKDQVAQVVDTMYKLGDLYADGDGVEVDWEAARKWWKQGNETRKVLYGACPNSPS